MDFAKGMRPHPAKQTMLPMPSKGAKLEERGGSMHVSDTLSRLKLAGFLSTIAELVRIGILETPLFVVMHHAGGFRYRIERDPGAERSADRMSGSIASFVRAIEAAELSCAAFEYQLECGCSLRVECTPEVPTGGAS